MRIIYSPQFKKEYSKLPLSVKEKFEKKEKDFRSNPFNRSLKIHKLSGQLRGLWSFSVDYEYRIIFEFAGKNEIFFHAVGDHSKYKRF